MPGFASWGARRLLAAVGNLRFPELADRLGRCNNPPIPSDSFKTELADDGRPALAALPGEHHSPQSPTRSQGGQKGLKADHFARFSHPNIRTRSC